MVHSMEFVDKSIVLSNVFLSVCRIVHAEIIARMLYNHRDMEDWTFFDAHRMNNENEMKWYGDYMANQMNYNIPISPPPDCHAFRENIF